MALLELLMSMQHESKWKISNLIPGSTQIIPFPFEGAYEHVYDSLLAQRSLTVFPRTFFSFLNLNKKFLLLQLKAL